MAKPECSRKLPKMRAGTGAPAWRGRPPDGSSGYLPQSAETGWELRRRLAQPCQASSLVYHGAHHTPRLQDGLNIVLHVLLHYEYITAPIFGAGWGSVVGPLRTGL